MGNSAYAQAVIANYMALNARDIKFGRCRLVDFAGRNEEESGLILAHRNQNPGCRVQPTISRYKVWSRKQLNQRHSALSASGADGACLAADVQGQLGKLGIAHRPAQKGGGSPVFSMPQLNRVLAKTR